MRKAKFSSQTKKATSNSTVTVTSHVSKMSPQLLNARKLWDSIQKAKTKKVIRDGAMIITNLPLFKVMQAKEWYQTSQSKADI